MVEVRIRGVDDDVVDALQRGAAAKRISLQAYLRDLLETEAAFVVSAEEQEEDEDLLTAEPYDCHTGLPIPQEYGPDEVVDSPAAEFPDAHRPRNDRPQQDRPDNVVALTRRGRRRTP